MIVVSMTQNNGVQTSQIDSQEPGILYECVGLAGVKEYAGFSGLDMVRKAMFSMKLAFWTVIIHERSQCHPSIKTAGDSCVKHSAKKMVDMI